MNRKTEKAFYCIICNGEKYKLIYNNTLKHCETCGFITANIEVGHEELKRIYNRNYFLGEEYLDYLADKPALQKNFTQRLSSIEENTHEEMEALEIGCAYGFFGEVFIKKFENATYTGLDIVLDAVNYGRQNFGLNLIMQDYLTYISGRKYTHIFMWDVIEHLPRPDKFIEKISEETETGSELYITTGDIGAFLPKIQGQNWRMIHPPTHLHYFSKKTLTLLLEKNNFEVKSIVYKPVFRSVKQIFFSLFLLGKPASRLRNKLFEKIPEKWSIPLNTYDIMYCTAVRK